MNSGRGCSNEVPWGLAGIAQLCKESRSRLAPPSRQHGCSGRATAMLVLENDCYAITRSDSWSTAKQGPTMTSQQERPNIARELAALSAVTMLRLTQPMLNMNCCNNAGSNRYSTVGLTPRQTFPIADHASGPPGGQSQSVGCAGAHRAARCIQ